MRVILAIDPGSVSGAFALRDHEGSYTVGDLPVVDKQVDAYALADFMHGMSPDTVVLERVGAMPKQGVSSTFKFGKAVGIALGVAAGIKARLIEVAPTVWKRHHNLLGADKERSRALAINRFPHLSPRLNLVKHHGRAEALLMLEYIIATGED